MKEHLNGTPLEAAAALVKEAVHRWQDEEDVVDDTSCVVAFLNYSKSKPAAAAAGVATTTTTTGSAVRDRGSPLAVNDATSGVRRM